MAAEQNVEKKQPGFLVRRPVESFDAKTVDAELAAVRDEAKDEASEEDQADLVHLTKAAATLARHLFGKTKGAGEIRLAKTAKSLAVHILSEDEQREAAQEVRRPEDEAAAPAAAPAAAAAEPEKPNRPLAPLEIDKRFKRGRT